MAESEQVVRLTGHEEIHAIRALISRAQSKRVLLVVPEGHAALRSEVRFKMLARHANEAALHLAIVSSDSAIRAQARVVNLSSFKTVEAGMRSSRWRQGQGRVAGTADDPSMRGGRRAVIERGQRLGSGGSWIENLILAGFIFGMLIVLAAVLVLILPSAQITLVPRQQTLEITFPVTVDVTAREVVRSQYLVPGQRVTIPLQGSQQVATSGRRDIPANPATGRVLFINVTGQGVQVPAGTVVSTSSGSTVRFRTTEAVAVSGNLGASASAPVEALVAGPVGNVGPLQIDVVEGAAATAVRVLNENGTAGGDVRQVSVVTAADKEQLKDQLEQRLVQEGRAALIRLIEQAPEQLLSTPLRGQALLLPETIIMEVIAETFDGSVDDPRDVLGLDMRVELSGLVVDMDQIETLAGIAIRTQVPDGYRLLEDGFETATGETGVGEEGLPILAVRAGAVAGATLAASEVRALVRGQPLDEARAILIQRLPLAADPSVEISPAWWSRLPYLPPRIFVRVGLLGGTSVTPPRAPQTAN